MGINRLQPAAAASGAPFTRLATVTSTSTWTHPDGASPASPKWIRVIGYSGGGGGGTGGRATASGTEPQAGGGGGGGAGYAFVTDFLLTSTLPITIGAGGTGAAGATLTNNGSSEGTTGTIASSGGTTIAGDFRIGGGGAGSNQYGRPYNNGDEAGGGGGLGIFSFTGTGIPSGGQGGFTGDGYNQDIDGKLRGRVGVVNTSLSYQVPPPGAGGSGGAGAWRSVAGSAQNSVLTTNLGTGGTGGAAGVASGAGSTATSGAGGNASGYASGGGGGGAAIVRSNSGSATTVSGAGGNGSPGVVYIYY